MEILKNFDMTPTEVAERCTGDEKICTFSIDMV